MNKSIFIVELICLTMICEVSSVSLRKCSIREKRKKINCAYGYTKTVQNISYTETSGPWLPNNVTASVVETLDISGNRYISAECNELIHLLQFNAKNLTFPKVNKGVSITNFKNCLGKMKVLEDLDLTNTSLGSSKLDGFDWPKRLTRLTLAKMKLKEIIGLEKLNHLQELDLSDNNLISFPKLNKTAPIISLYLRGNKMTNITVEDLASYCEMSSFSVPDQINDAKNHDYCAPLEEWAKKYSIDTSETLSCKHPEGNHSKRVTFSEEAIKARITCLNALPGTGIWDILFFAVFFSILFPLLYYANEAYNNYQAKKLEPTPAPVKRRRRRRTTTASPMESDHEGSHTEDTPPELDYEES